MPYLKTDMSDQKKKEDKAKRLAEQLRANLARRKSQARARRACEGDARRDGIKAAKTEDKE
ncbi:hypothetical protein [Ahrensia sp. 13_GOM-1096m]|uniref:hypothetical protein n=1 Tax=Ahrensia sp. 13_GOM-1096m TaxID=1380380 RepID=UPI00047ED7B0|nr:hypothetical protein [Ahrensia sp. 13_GOM-1096m]